MLAAELELLTQALGDPVADVAETLRRFDLDVHSAVRTYLGMTVTVYGQIYAHLDGDHDGRRRSDGNDSDANGDDDRRDRYTFTALSDSTRAAEARTSLLVPLSDATVILYAAMPGALIDMAADLAWLTGRPLADYVLDAHLPPAPAAATDGPLRAAATVNQAIGVLVGRGRSLDQARNELEALANKDATDLLDAARTVLGSLGGTDPRV